MKRILSSSFKASRLKDKYMFSVYDVQTREITSNMTVDKVADFLIAKGALSEERRTAMTGYCLKTRNG